MIDEIALKAPTEADRKPFIAAMRASVAFHQPWMTAACSDEEYDAYLARAADPRADINLLYRVSDGAILGFFNLGEIVRGLFHSAYLGYGAAAEQAGKGYMTRGMQLLFARAFDELQLHRIEANIQPGNTPSLTLARRSGFIKEGFSEAYLKIGGVWCDHERWAIRAEQWRERNARATTL